ncbi:homocysteine S-methyltransferase [Pseudalkalibacillus hwajinpoensis]|uniref:homocysteine S-methyltransferase n=1 Tax=Guptibacillus hwajinpoensis TaxID=208199 RepID=UPI00325B77AE
MLLKNDPIEGILRDYSIMILDGALATELEHYGCDLNDPLWSARVLLENPELIYQVHLDYFHAGADCAITASYQATIDGLKARGLNEQESIELIKKTVVLARKARDDFWEQNEQLTRPKPLVAASVGPYGAFLSDGSEYRGDYGVSDDTLAHFHRSRIKALIDAGADLLAFETIPSLQEANVLLSLLEEFPHTYAWLSFSIRNGKEISDGTPLQECSKRFGEIKQLAAIGVNCASPSFVEEVIKEVNSHTKKPVIVYPNSGEVYESSSKTWQGEQSHSELDQDSKRWFQVGARLIGGCCRTRPHDIEEIYQKWR